MSFADKMKKGLHNPYKFLELVMKRVPLIGHAVSDRAYISIKYRSVFGRKPDLVSPKTFNEKLQWLKLHDRKPIYTKLVDKYEVKKYVASTVGEEYVIPTLGVWKRFDDIDFDALPDQFVLKCTHDSGGIVICRDKSEFNLDAARKKIDKCLKRNYYWRGREWPYKGVQPRIIAEPYMEDCEAEPEDGGKAPRAIRGLTDYKFYCFHGKPEFLYISRGLENHATASISFLTMEWAFAPFRRSDYRAFDSLPEKPKGFEEMVRLCKALSKESAFVRVDLYQIGGRVYFSELTFSPCSGLMPFEPKEWDRRLGDLLRLKDE